MNGLVRKLVISVLSLCFAVVMVSTVSFAWLTMTNSNTTDGLSLRISTGDELQFSLDGTNYFNVLPSHIIMENLRELSFRDVTSMDGENFKAGGPYGTGIARKNVDYFSLTFWVRTTTIERHVYLVDNISKNVDFNMSVDGTFVVSRGVNWKADLTFINGQNALEDIVSHGDRAMYYASDAIRISFIEEQDTNNPFDTRDNESLSRFIYDPSENPLRGYGVAYGALSYYNLKKGMIVEAPKDIPNVIYKLSEFAPNNPYTALDDNSRIMELIETDLKDSKNQTYYAGKVTINVWLEGWDADCFDAIYQDIVKVQLKFRVGKSQIVSM